MSGIPEAELEAIKARLHMAAAALDCEPSAMVEGVNRRFEEGHPACRNTLEYNIYRPIRDAIRNIDAALHWIEKGEGNAN